jgi:hypothetical protein
MITWAEIEAEAEASGYRERLVAVFRKYENEETDERDKYNRPVRVTVASFADHMGVPRTTFQYWEKMVSRVGTISDEERGNKEAARARRAVREDPQAVASAVANLPDEQRSQFLDAVTNAVYGQGTAERRQESWDQDRQIRKQHTEDQNQNSGLEREMKIKILTDELVRDEQWYHLSRARDYINGSYDSHNAADLDPAMFK